MEFRVLGPLQVVVDGTPVPLPGAAERALLALLLLDARRVVPAEHLVDSLWGEDPPVKVANALQGRVSRLRSAFRAAGLPESLLVSRRPGYLLDVDREAVDAHRFARLLDEARRAEGSAAARLYAAALQLWQGPALAEFDQDWARDQRQRWEELRLAATEEWVEVRLAAGRHAELVSELTGLVARHPLRERLHGQLMTALYRMGRQADALAAYQRARRTLGDELGIDPSPELRALEQAILRQDPGLVGPDGAEPVEVRPALPTRLTSLVGRHRERAQLRDLLRSRRLVTLTGPGGVGKTSLSIAVAADAADLAADGTWFAGLAGVSDAGALAPAVADAVGAPTGPGSAEDRVLRHLRRREALVVLDNCEHLVAECADLVGRLLAASPGLRILATSREPLAIGGEARFPLAPLAVPPVHGDPAEIAAADSVRLFVDRARDHDPGFALDEETGPPVVTICRRLDGLPLALELAAARVKVLPVHELADRLDDRFRLLTTGPRSADERQRTLRAVVDWSHDLLTDAERTLFRRLAVFRGGWSLAAAEDVCARPGLDAGSILDLHARLVDRSLIVPRTGPGFGLLETLRAYAAERLDEAGERADVEAAHAAHYTRLAAEAEPRLRGADQDRALSLLRGERDNLRAALAWGRAHPSSELGLRLAAALGWFWYFTSAQEGIAELESVIAAAPGRQAARARALQALAVVARPGSCIVHPDPRCAAAARESRELFAADGDTVAAAYSATLLAVEGIDGPDPAGSLDLLDDAAAEFDRADDRWGRALELFVRMELQFLVGDADAATAHGARALELFRALDDHWGISAVQYHHGLALHRAGRLDAARVVHEAAIAQGRRGLTNTVPYALVDMGHIALEQGDHDRAEQHFAEAIEVAQQLGAEGSAAASLGEGHLARERGDLGAAARHYASALRLVAERGTPEWEAAVHNGLGFVAGLTGDLDAAEADHRTAWQAASRAPVAGARAAATALEGLACCAAIRGDATLAAGLLGTAARWRRSRHQPALRLESADIDRAAERARGLLGDAVYQQAYARGLEPPPDAVVDLEQSAEAQLAAWLREPAQPG